MSFPIRFAVSLAALPLIAAQATDPGVTVTTLVKSLPGGTGGLEVDAQGFVYSSDFGSKLGPGSVGGDRIFKVDPENGSFEVFATGMRGASGNEIGPDGHFFQSNIGGQSISRISPDGKVAPFATTGLQQPVGIVADAEGMLFVANCGSASITEITPEGKVSRFASSPLLKCPNGIALDEDHNLYVANFGNGDVIKIGWGGEASKLATLPGNGNGHLVYRDGQLYVVARNAHQIYRVTLAGKVELLAGSGKRGHGDGPALQATFCFPNDLAFSPDGKTLYVNENFEVDGSGTTLAPTTVRSIHIGE